MCTFFLCQEFNPTQTAVHSTKTLPPINHRGRSWPCPSDFGLNHPLRLTGQRKGMGGGAGLGLGLLRRWERHSTRPPKQQQMQDQGPTSLLWEGGGCNKAGWCTKSHLHPYNRAARSQISLLVAPVPVCQHKSIPVLFARHLCSPQHCQLLAYSFVGLYQESNHYIPRLEAGE